MLSTLFETLRALIGLVDKRTSRNASEKLAPVIQPKGSEFSLAKGRCTEDPIRPSCGGLRLLLTLASGLWLYCSLLFVCFAHDHAVLFCA